MRATRETEGRILMSLVYSASRIATRLGPVVW